MANISKEIIESCILPRLPVKSLIRFKCVSKSWLTLISSPYFIRLHHRHALSTDANRLIIGGYMSWAPNCFYIYNFDSPVDNPSLCTFPMTDSSRRPTVIASCEFFLLIRIAGNNNKYDDLIMLNPSTRSYHEIPRQNFLEHCRFVKYGICFDEANNDYKVIIQYSDPGGLFNCSDGIVKILIYSFRTNSWRLIEHKLKSAVFYDGSNDVVAINNLLYMRVTDHLNYNKSLRIACFDIQAEQWTNDVPLPNDINLNCDFCLSQLDGSICVTGYENKKLGTYCVWVMKDYCWVKLIMSLNWRSDDTTEELLLYNCFKPIAYLTGSQHELLCVRNFDHGAYRYDTRDQVARFVKFIDYCFSDEDTPKYVVKGSLVTFSNKLRSLIVCSKVWT